VGIPVGQKALEGTLAGYERDVVDLLAEQE